MLQQSSAISVITPPSRTRASVARSLVPVTVAPVTSVVPLTVRSDEASSDPPPISRVAIV